MTGALRADIRRCTDNERSYRTLAQLLARNYGLQALVAYRLGRWLLRSRRDPYRWPLLPLGWSLYFLLNRYVRLAFDIRLELSADIGPGAYIGHFGGLHLRRCSIGANCSIGRLTHIGPAADGEGPVIGERVWIGAHVRILGAYRIGSGATVSAGAVVRRDIPDRALCLGDPARIVLRDYDNRSILGLEEETAAALRILPAILPPE
jgi:serine O-acetyltransferase